MKSYERDICICEFHKQKGSGSRDKTKMNTQSKLMQIELIHGVTKFLFG